MTLARSMVSVCILILLATFPATASADLKCKTAKGKALVVEGIKAYNVGKYEDAIAQFEAAYLECDDPAILFNLGQANRKAAHYERARDIYKAWMRDPRTKKDADRAIVKKNIDELDKLLAKQQQSTDAPPEGVRPREGTEAITTAVPEPAPPVSTTPPAVSESSDPKTNPDGAAPPARHHADQAPDQRPIDETRRPWTRDTLGWILAGTGVASMLVGTGFIVWSNSIEDDARGAMYDVDADRLFDDAESKRTIGAITTVVGGALLVGGIVHFALYGRSAHDSRPASVSVGPGSVAFSWSF